VLFVPVPIKDTAKSAVRVKFPALVTGSITCILAIRFKVDGDTVKETGRPFLFAAPAGVQ